MRARIDLPPAPPSRSGRPSIRLGLGLCLFLLLPAAVATSAGKDSAADLSAEERAAVDSIRARNLVATIRFLAADVLEGREAGRTGGNITEAYLVSRFQGAGLEGTAKEGYRQAFDLRWRALSPQAGFRLERQDGGGTTRREWQAGRDFVPLSFSEEGEVEAPVVFLGYGIEAPEHRWNDWSHGGISARGRIVLLFRHEPDEEGTGEATWFEGGEMSLHASLRQKARAARSHGAVGVIIVDDPLHHDVRELSSGGGSRIRVMTEADRAKPREDDAWFRGRPDTSDADAPLGIVAVHASQEVLRWLAPDMDWKTLQREMDEGRRPRALEFQGATARIAHRVEASRRGAANVLAILPGSDPELSKEYVLVGGHHDHLGKDATSGEIHNGADDNASGTAAVVAIAEAFAAMPSAPPRSLLFATWSAEEKGLLGSDWFVHHPPVELGSIVAAINLDMVGRNDPKQISVVGRNETPDLVQLFERFAPVVGLSLNDDAGAGAGRSDNASLWLAGIPTASLFSGSHEDYHEPSDTADKIVQSKVEAAARLAFLVANEVAQARTTPRHLVVPRGPWEAIAPASRQEPEAGRSRP